MVKWNICPDGSIDMELPRDYDSEDIFKGMEQIADQLFKYKEVYHAPKKKTIFGLLEDYFK